MTVRIASFNLENLFTRPTAMMLENEKGQQAVDDHALANTIIAKQTYSEADKQALIELDRKYRFSASSPPDNALVKLNKVRGQLYLHPKEGPVSVVAVGRGDWTGWFELLRRDVSWPAVLNTGKVIEEVNPDVLICIEVEDRPTLQRFNDQVLGAVLHDKYPYVMVIDGNDSRGIDVGLLSRFPIVNIRSHVDDKNGKSLIFSRDCPEYTLELPSGKLITICPNHFKSKRGGNDEAAQARRLAQCTRAAEIAREAEKKNSWVLVGGDLNDTPDSPAVAPLLLDDWADIQSHADYPKDRPGTFSTGLAGNKIDYLIMSPSLRGRLKTVGIERRGTYHPKLWEAFESVTAATEASDHHCIWADFDI